MTQTNHFAKSGRRFITFALVAGAFLLAFSSQPRAEDLKNRWYFGSNLSFLSTTDNIRSNAAILVGPYGDDGIPFTGDPNEPQGCQLPNFCDPRPDNLLGRETSIEETFKVDFTAGYGLTSWFSLQFDASYFKGDVGPVDTFLRQANPTAPLPSQPTRLTVVRVANEVFPVQAGQLTEIPVSLTGIIRFRKDSPLNPYIGFGAGMIFAEIDGFGDVDALNGRLGEMRIRQVNDEFNNLLQPFNERGLNPFVYPASVEVKDAFEWHLTGGAEYFFNDRFSMVFDARYTFADQELNISLGGEDQVNLNIWSEVMFRDDGSQLMFSSNGLQLNAACGDLPPAQRAQAAGCFDNSGNPKGDSAKITCTAGAPGDFDGDGKSDLCYNPNIFTPPGAPGGVGGFVDPTGKVVVQGGSISLTAFSVAIGARFHF